MDRKIILTTLAAALMGLIGVWLLLSLKPPAAPPGPPRLPWDVAQPTEGQVQVFGLTLGESRLSDLRALLGESGKLSLFIEPSGSMTVEAFFDDIILSQIRADWVVTLQVPEDALDAMFGRGTRISGLGAGTRKVTLAAEDVVRLAEAPLRRITYLPWKRLEARDITGNFGEPAEILDEESGISHWLYPHLGMDIARDPDGAVVIQYLNSDDFRAARARLPLANPPTGSESSAIPHSPAGSTTAPPARSASAPTSRSTATSPAGPTSAGSATGEAEAPLELR